MAAKIEGPREPTLCERALIPDMRPIATRTCVAVQEAISAQLDDEDPGMTPELVEAHLRTCDDCRRFQARSTGINRRVRLRRSEPVPDLTARILAAIGETGGAIQRRLVTELRVGLLGVAIAQLVLAVPPLIMGSDDGASIHLARHEGSFGLAIAVGFLLAAWRPARAAGLVGVMGVLATCLIVTAAVDVAAGHTTAVAELDHLPVVVGFALLWLLVHPFRRARGLTSAAG